MAAVGVAVEQLDALSTALHHIVMNYAAHRNCAHWHSGIGQAFCHTNDVWGHAPRLRCGGTADAPEGADDFIENQDDAVLGANVTKALQVTDRRYEHASGASNWLDNHCRNRLCAVQCNQPLQMIGQFNAVCRKAFRPGVACVVVGMRQMIDAGQPLPPATVVDNAADRNPAETGAMIATFATDQAVAGGLASRALCGE